MFGGGALGLAVLLLAVLALMGGLRLWVAFCDYRLRRRVYRRNQIRMIA